jgi:putative transposase
MRTARKKVVGVDAYYHVASRLSGPVDEYPLTEVDRERGMAIVGKASRLFLIEPISMCWMGNHWHLVCWVPGAAPEAADAAERWNAFYGKRSGRQVDVKAAPERCSQIADQLVDLSQFMRYVNQAFTFYYNRAHRRRGPLWADRFKSTIVEGTQALWNCVKYVELNPVRAGLEEDPGAYRFSTWGWHAGSGKHFFGVHFVRHLRRSLGEAASGWSEAEVLAEFRGELARTLAYEREEPAPHEAKAAAKRGETMPVCFLRRTRHWTDGAIIGSKAFVQEMGCQFEERSRVMKRQFSRGKAPVAQGGQQPLYCLKQLRPALE